MVRFDAVWVVFYSQAACLLPILTHTQTHTAFIHQLTSASLWHLFCRTNWTSDNLFRILHSRKIL